MGTRRSNSHSNGDRWWQGRFFSAPGSLWHWSLTRTGRNTWLGIGIAAAVITSISLIPALGRRVEGPVEQVEIRFERSPAWAGPSILDHLNQLAASRLAGTSLSRYDLSDTRQLLLNSGFFNEVHQVRRSGPAEVTIDATLVTPRASVKDRHGSALIDGSGRLMPPGCGLAGDVHLVTIVNPRYSRPARPRETWNGGDLAAALRVLERIYAAKWIEQVEAIDLSRYAGGGSLVLITDNGSRIVWGSAPGDEKAMESLLERKLARLDRLHRLSGRIDQYHPGEIDITDASVVVKR